MRPEATIKELDQGYLVCLKHRASGTWEEHAVIHLDEAILKIAKHIDHRGVKDVTLTHYDWSDRA